MWSGSSVLNAFEPEGYAEGDDPDSYPDSEVGVITHGHGRGTGVVRCLTPSERADPPPSLPLTERAGFTDALSVASRVEAHRVRVQADMLNFCGSEEIYNNKLRRRRLHAAWLRRLNRYKQYH